MNLLNASARAAVLLAAAALCRPAAADRLDEMPRPWAKPAERLTLRTYIGSLEWFKAQHPGLAKLAVVGRSPKGLPVYLLKLTDARTPDDDKNVILITGFHSGAERTGTAGIMAVAEWLLGGSKPAADALKRNVVLLMPIVNPEGYFTSEHWGNSRNMDVYALGRGNRVNLETQDLKVPEDGPEVLAYRAVADRYHPDLHLDVHGTGFHFNGHIQPPSVGRAGSNAALLCWDERLVRRMTDAAARDGWGNFLFESDPQRILWSPAMGAAQKPYCDGGAPYYYSATYGYMKHHTLPLVIEATWADQVLSPVKELFAFTGGAMRGGPAPGFAVNRVKTCLSLSVEPFGATRAARRESRVDLWQKQRHVTLAASYPDTANWRMGVVAYGRDGLEAVAGPAATNAGAWVYAPVADFRKRLEGRPGFDLAAIDRFLAAAPPAALKLPVETPDFDGRDAPSPDLRHGLSVTLALPTATNEILHLALNGRPLAPSEAADCQRWTEDGFTFVRVGIPPARAAAERLWVVTCAWKPVGLPDRFGWTPSAEAAAWIGSPAFTDGRGGAECARAEKIDAYWRRHRDKFHDRTFTGSPDDDDAAAPDLSKCVNVAGALYGSFAEATHADGTKTKADSAIAGSYEDGAAVTLRGVPSVLTVTFARPRLLCGAAVWPGTLGTAGNASGECGVASYEIECFNNGYWHKTAEAKGRPSFAASKAKGAKDYRFVHAFAKPVNATAIRLRVTESGDTGRRMDKRVFIPPEKRVTAIRAFEAYETATDENRLTLLANVLTGDFLLPVYRAQKEAVLSLARTASVAPFDARMEVRGADGAAPAVLTRNVRFGRGATRVAIPLEGLPDGRYVVSFTARDAKIKGDLRRMLRIDRGGAAAPPAEPVDVTGVRVFPVDGFHFAVRTGVANEVVPAETVETTRPLAPDRCVQDARGGAWLNRRADGTFVMQFRDADWKRSDWKTHYTVSDDLKTWRITDAPPDGKPNVALPSPWDPLPAPARPKWQVRTPFKDAKIRFWEAADGRPPLAEVRVAWFPPSLGDIAARGLVPWGNYPVWEKNAGEWIVLTKDPMMVCKFGFEPQELEDDLASNDNFGGQFLSDDGGTVFYEQAAKLRRFPPYTVEYDNLRQASRILRAFWSHDGFTWHKRFMALPDEGDHWSFQHYGLSNFRVTRDFYVGYLHAYPADRQQIYPEVVYSRDGLNWNRIPGAKPFIANTPPGTWLSGMVFLDPVTPYEHDGRYLIPVGTPHRNLHFYLYNLRTQPERLTAAYVEQCFGGRNLAEQWPLFKAIGGWEGLAKDMREYAATVGIASFRKDGWIAVKAGAGGGLLVSRVFSAPGARLLLNAKGSVTAALASAAGRPIPGYERPASFTGDATAAPLAWPRAALPAEPFTLTLTLAPGTELYTLAFRN